MNAHTPATTLRGIAFDDQVGDVAGKLHQIDQLAAAASIVIEHELGRAGPAEQLDVILAMIQQVAREAEQIRRAIP